MDGGGADLIIRADPCLGILVGGGVELVVLVGPCVQVRIVMVILEIAPELKGVADLLVEVDQQEIFFKAVIIEIPLACEES